MVFDMNDTGIAATNLVVYEFNTSTLSHLNDSDINGAVLSMAIDTFNTGDTNNYPTLFIAGYFDSVCPFSLLLFIPRIYRILYHHFMIVAAMSLE
jgi:hypothetical protein